MCVCMTYVCHYDDEKFNPSQIVEQIRLFIHRKGNDISLDLLPKQQTTENDLCLALGHKFFFFQ